MTDAPQSTTTTDPRPHFAAAYALAGKVIAGIRPDQLASSTPCTGFDVAGLLDHLRMAAERAGRMGRNDNPFQFTPEAGPADGDHAGWWQARAEAVLAGWTDARLADTIELPWATVTGAAALAGYVNEITLHTWDLAAATGQAVAWDDEVVALGLRALQAVLPGQGRVDRFEAIRATMPPAVQVNMERPFADPVEVPADAPLIEQAVAYAGRDPRAWPA